MSRQPSITAPFLSHAGTNAGLAALSLAGMCGLLAACGTPASQRGADAEQCYRHGAMRTCTAAQPATPSQIAAVHRMSAPPLGRGRILIVRNDWADAHGHAIVRLDGQELIDTIPCTVFAVDVRPGPHLLQINPAASSEPLPVETASGQLQVLKAVREAGGTGRRGFRLVPTEAGDARSLVQECRVLGLLDRTAVPASPGSPGSPAKD